MIELTAATSVFIALKVSTTWIYLVINSLQIQWRASFLFQEHWVLNMVPDMNHLLFVMCLLGINVAVLTGQPVEIIGPLVSLDLDANSSIDFQYSASGQNIGDMPEEWLMGYSLDPWGDSRILRDDDTRIPFKYGDVVDGKHYAVTNVFGHPPRPTIETYGVSILSYRAVKRSDWVYSSVSGAFESETDLYFGLRIAQKSGYNYGWIRMTRPVADSHAEFKVVEYAYHPVPGQSIQAGLPPSLPPLQTQVDSTIGLTLSWDPRWGSLILESTTNLGSAIAWESVGVGNGGPVSVSDGEKQRFYRLRQPCEVDGSDDAGSLRASASAKGSLFSKEIGMRADFDLLANFWMPLTHPVCFTVPSFAISLLGCSTAFSRLKTPGCHYYAGVPLSLRIIFEPCLIPFRICPPCVLAVPTNRWTKLRSRITARAR